MGNDDQVYGCILGGGQARRMGGKDKPLLPLGGRPLLDHVIARIAPHTAALVINANGDPSRYRHFHLPVIADPIAGFAGPLAGILAGLEWTQARSGEKVLTVPADTPFLPRDLVARLTAAGEGKDIACAASGGRLHPVIGLWPVRLAPDLRHALTAENIRKVEAFTARLRLGIAEWPVLPYDPFFNINRPADLAEAERMLSEFSP